MRKTRCKVCGKKMQYTADRHSGEVVIDTFCDDYDGCYFEEDGEMYGITPVYWMPLPEKPKEEEK